MLRRLLLSLLIACLALPATAAPMAMASNGVAASTTPCHGEPPVTDHQPGKVTLKHQCIGCIPPVAAFPAVVHPPALQGVAAPAFVVKQFSGESLQPAVPPPRA